MCIEFCGGFIEAAEELLGEDAAVDFGSMVTCFATLATCGYSALTNRFFADMHEAVGDMLTPGEPVPRTPCPVPRTSYPSQFLFTRHCNSSCASMILESADWFTFGGMEDEHGVTYMLSSMMNFYEHLKSWIPEDSGFYRKVTTCVFEQLMFEYARLLVTVPSEDKKALDEGVARDIEVLRALVDGEFVRKRVFEKNVVTVRLLVEMQVTVA